jgi:hypothetical protein
MGHMVKPFMWHCSFTVEGDYTLKGCGMPLSP